MANFYHIVAFCFFILEVSPLWALYCPHTSDESPVKLYNGTCYQFIHTETSWPKARDSCVRRGAQLVQILNSNTQIFIYNSLRHLRWDKNGVWLGANDLAKNGYWVWTTGEKLHYANWGKGQGSPSIGNFLFPENCVVMRLDHQGQWHDYPCDLPLFHYTYICQMAASTEQPTSSESSSVKHQQTKLSSRPPPTKTSKGLSSTVRETTWKPSSKKVDTESSTVRTHHVTRLTTKLKPRTRTQTTVLTLTQLSSSTKKFSNKAQFFKSTKIFTRPRTNSLASKTTLLPRPHQTDLASGKTSPQARTSKPFQRNTFPSIKPKARSTTLNKVQTSTRPSLKPTSNVFKMTTHPGRSLLPKYTSTIGENYSATNLALKKKSHERNSDHHQTVHKSSNTGVYVGVPIAIVFLLSLVIAGVIYNGRRFGSKNLPSSFDNPLYSQKK